MTAVRLPAPQRRRQLLDRALRVFSERGFHATSMNDVAEAAGVTKPVLYQHFPSKRDLYLELLRDVGRQLTATITAATTAEEAVQAKTVAGLAAYFRFVQEQQAAFKLLFGSGSRRDESFAAAVRQVEDEIGATIAELLDPHIDAGRRLVIAHGILGMAEGTCRLWLGKRLDLDPEELAGQVGELLYGGLHGLDRSRV
jgi:AcrR family transcriptional regulator